MHKQAIVQILPTVQILETAVLRRQEIVLTQEHQIHKTQPATLLEIATN